jgi:hypothetical protein
MISKIERCFHIKKRLVTANVETLIRRRFGYSFFPYEKTNFNKRRPNHVWCAGADNQLIIFGKFA